MPVLAAIQGGCIGGGVDMVSACDMRYATRDAFFCIQEINIGMTADVGTFQRLPKMIPQGIVRELAYTGDRLPAAAGATRCGFVNAALRRPRAAARRHARHRRRHRQALAAGGVGLQGDAQLRPRPHESPTRCATSRSGRPACSSRATCCEAFAAKAEKRDPEFDDLPVRPGGN